MIEILALFRTVLALCAHFSRNSGRKLVQPMLTAACITGVYTAVHVTQEGGVLSGLRVAFLDNDMTRSQRRRAEEQVFLQGELRQFVAANKLINQLLHTMLERGHGASRVQLNVIHNGVMGLTGTGLLRYDLANSVAGPGRVSGPTVTNQPLSDWNDFLPDLLSGQCTFHHVADLHSASIQARFQEMGAEAFLVCPAGDVQGKIVGALFIVWDKNDPAPDEASLQSLMLDGRQFGGQVAAILDLRGPPPWPEALPAGG